MRRCTNEAIVGEYGCYRCYTDLQVERFSQLNTGTQGGLPCEDAVMADMALCAPHSH